MHLNLHLKKMHLNEIKCIFKMNFQNASSILRDAIYPWSYFHR